MKEKLELEFVLSVSPKLLYQHVSTEEGLSKWFADKISIQNDNLTFVWSKQNYEAKILAQKECKLFKYAWIEDIKNNNNYYVEFSIISNNNDNITTLKIVDFTEPEEKSENIMLWKSNVDQLKRALGING